MYLRAWRAYSEEGLEAFLERCAPDIVVEEYAGAPGAQVWHGREGLREMWSRWAQDFEGFLFEPKGEPEQIADQAFARRVRVRGTGRGSGVKVDWNLVMVSVLRDDGLVAHQFLVDTVEEARARVG
jgi:ketosteroid isomerase-like protein